MTHLKPRSLGILPLGTVGSDQRTPTHDAFALRPRTSRRIQAAGTRQADGEQSGTVPAAEPTRTDYVKVALAAQLTGYSQKAIRRKIESGVWVEGQQYRRAPDGRVLISLTGYEKWVEKGRA
jgi:hypothetical protein